MSDYDNSNRGAIWKNDKKEKDTQPDFKGNMDVGGVEYWVSAWKRKPDANPAAPALSFSVQRKDEQASAPATPAAQPTPQQSAPPPYADDDIPF